MISHTAHTYVQVTKLSMPIELPLSLVPNTIGIMLAKTNWWIPLTYKRRSGHPRTPSLSRQLDGVQIFPTATPSSASAGVNRTAKEQTTSTQQVEKITSFGTFELKNICNFSTTPTPAPGSCFPPHWRHRLWVLGHSSWTKMTFRVENLLGQINHLKSFAVLVDTSHL